MKHLKRNLHGNSFRDTFEAHFYKCPEWFQRQFIHCCEGLLQSDKVTAIEGIVPMHHSKTDFKLLIDKSRIGIKLEGNTVVFVCFIHNQFIVS